MEAFDKLLNIAAFLDICKSVLLICQSDFFVAVADRTSKEIVLFTVGDRFPLNLPEGSFQFGHT